MLSKESRKCLIRREKTNLKECNISEILLASFKDVNDFVVTFKKQTSVKLLLALMKFGLTLPVTGHGIYLENVYLDLNRGLPLRDDDDGILACLES